MIYNAQGSRNQLYRVSDDSLSFCGVTLSSRIDSGVGTIHSGCSTRRFSGSAASGVINRLWAPYSSYSVIFSYTLNGLRDFISLSNGVLSSSICPYWSVSRQIVTCVGMPMSRPDFAVWSMIGDTGHTGPTGPKGLPAPAHIATSTSYPIKGATGPTGPSRLMTKSVIPYNRRPNGFCRTR